MGGPGSGSYYQWWRPARKTTVEQCLSLDANRWMREGILKAGVHLRGSCRWTYGDGRENSITYAVDTLDPACPVVQLSYTSTRAGTQERESLDYPVELTSTRPRYGGLRWWFVCPLVVRGCTCERRVGKLYLPPGGRYFGCRLCCRLTYHSTQTHDSRVSRLRRNPALLAAMMEDPEGASVGQLILAMKALR
jgi:hypothetical protein